MQLGSKEEIQWVYAAHHCYWPSLLRLIEDAVLQERVDAIYILDATVEHGWTKVYYMPLDCRSPEDFRNITLSCVCVRRFSVLPRSTQWAGST